MKIALVILHADPARGGAERYTLDLAAALVRRGHDVKLLSTTFGDEAAPEMRVPIDAPGATRTGRYKRFLENLDQHLNETRYDVIHAMLPVNRCDLYHPHAGIAAERSGSRFFNPRRGAMAKVEQRLLTSPNPPIVLVLSDYVKSFVLKHYSLPTEKLQRLFNAVDLGRFEPGPSLDHDYVNGLFIGQDFERKGLMPTLVAASMLKDPKLKITVVGKRSGKFHPPPDAAAQVSFAGETREPLPFYRDADFFVLPTKHDPCSLVVLEALAMGVPVISTKFNGATEIMTDGVHGFVLPDSTDVDALAGAMRWMLDPQIRAKMREACLALRPQLSYEHHLNQLEQIYQRVAKR